MKLLSKSEPGFLASLEVGAFKGAIKDLSSAEYHGLSRYWSSTALKYMSASSPAHFKARYITKEVAEKEPTDKMILGTVVHSMVLTPELTDSEIFVMPVLNLRTNEGKAQKQALIDANPGKLMIDEEMHAQARAMTLSCMNNSQAMKLLENGKKEASFFWTCLFSNLKFRARADSACSTSLVELKTTSDASPEAFSRLMHSMNYDLSLKHYQEGIRITMDVAPPPYFIVIEDKAPFVTQVYKVGQSVLETGHQKWLEAVSKLAKGVDQNDWPAYSSLDHDVETIEMPPWVTNKLMKESGDGI